MNIKFLIFSLLFCLIGVNLSFAQDTNDLENIYNSYIAAVKEKDFNKVLNLFTSKVQKEISSQSKTKKEKTEFLKMTSYQIPESYETLYLEPGGDTKSATLHTILQLSELKEIERERSRIECDVTYKLENDSWKLDSFLFLGDPDKVSHPKDYSYDPEYVDAEREGDVGGRIVKTEFLPGYTMVIIRVLDEENVVFLPSKADLLKQGYNPDELKQWNIVDIKGNPHKKDKVKFFGNSFTRIIPTE